MEKTLFKTEWLLVGTAVILTLTATILFFTLPAQLMRLDLVYGAF